MPTSWRLSRWWQQIAKHLLWCPSSSSSSIKLCSSHLLLFTKWPQMWANTTILLQSTSVPWRVRLLREDLADGLLELHGWGGSTWAGRATTKMAHSHACLTGWCWLWPGAPPELQAELGLPHKRVTGCPGDCDGSCNAAYNLHLESPRTL